MYKSVKCFLLLLIAVAITTSVSFAQHDDMKSESKGEKSMEPVGVKTDVGVLYGKSYDPGMTLVSYEELIKDPSANNDKVVMVQGNVLEVCQAMGCWMIMSDGTTGTRVKTGHEFFLPKDIAGQSAYVVGKFKVTEISEDDAKHYNEESSNPSVKTESIKGPQKVYELDATGIVILNPDAKSDSKPDSNPDVKSDTAPAPGKN
ncbi:MAG TPA: DUF4920 domain-containing protein [Ignavibacteria bacterium]|nr:DUF4920 domain-containing protein [Ignavibacteria bacterium]